MGKPVTHVVHVPRWITVALLVAVSAAMVALIASLSGRAYLREPTRLSSVAAVVADILFFVPWGALAFLSFDGGEARRPRTYIVTMAVGLTFALGLAAWQSALPTRVTGWYDVVWQGVGCFAGAVAGHLRKRVRLRFE